MAIFIVPRFRRLFVCQSCVANRYPVQNIDSNVIISKTVTICCNVEASFIVLVELRLANQRPDLRRLRSCSFAGGKCLQNSANVSKKVRQTRKSPGLVKVYLAHVLANCATYTQRAIPNASVGYGPSGRVMECFLTSMWQ